MIRRASRTTFKSLQGIGLAFLLGFIPDCRATANSGSVLFSADDYTQNFQSGITQGKGHVQISLSDRVLRGDEVEINNKTHELTAKGNLSVEKGSLVIRAERAELDLDTGFGTFYNATLQNGAALYVEGRELTYYARDRYRARQGKLTTCRDCPQSWSLVGAQMDFEIEGFAEVHHAILQIRDIPVFYFPVYFIPVKTKRQSGFLMPRYSSLVDLGQSFEVPYFWAISQDSDATLSPTYMSREGVKLTGEARYMHSDRSYLVTRFSALQRSNGSSRPDLKSAQDHDWRGGFMLGERWQLTPHLTQRFRAELQTDPIYSIHFSNDFFSSRLPALENEPSLVWQDSNHYAYGLFRLYRDNLPRNQRVLKSPLLGDTAYQGALQNAPELGYSLTSLRLWGPLRFNADLRQVSFRRRGSSVDPVSGWVREGDRATAILRLAAPQNVFSFFQWKPSLELRGDVYRFDAPGVEPHAYRFRYLLDQTFGATISRVWGSSVGDLRAIKHTVTPFLRHSYSDLDRRTDHPFFNRPDAPRFDLFDPNSIRPSVELGNAFEEQRLRPNHLLTFAVSSRIIGRFGETQRRYDELLGAEVARDLNLFARDAQGRPVWNRLRIRAFGNYAGAHIETNIALDPKTKNADFQNDVSYRWNRYYLGVSQFITRRQCLECVGGQSQDQILGTSVEVRDLGPISLAAQVRYDVVRANAKPKQDPWTQVDYQIYHSGSSLCWYFNFRASRQPVPDQANKFEFDYKPQIGFVFAESGKRSSLGSYLQDSQAGPGAR